MTTQDPDAPQIYLITPPEFDLGTFPDRLSRVLDGVETACLRLSLATRDEDRLMRAAEEYAGTQPKGLLTEVRFDVALVDSHGIFRVMENAFA